MLRIFFLLSYVFFSINPLLGAPITKDKNQLILPLFEQQIQKGMQENHIPGAVVAIIMDNQVVYMKGFGVRKEGENETVTPETIFQVASVSKPMTTTVLAALVGENVVQWDSRVTVLNPSFQLKDPWITRELTLKDLLSHRSGLPDHAGDLLEDLGFDQSTILYKLRFEPLVGFRDHYEYTNFGFSEAAYASAFAIGIPWDVLVRQKLFDPLGMTSATTRYADLIEKNNRATLHFIQNGTARPLYQRNPDSQRPAGGFALNMQDFTKWMLLQLSSGEYQGKQIISSEALQQTQKPVMVRGQKSFYGLGWNVDYNDQGNIVLSHGGGFESGAETSVKLIPEEKFGIGVFANSSPTGFAEALIDTFMELREKGRVEKNWFSIWKERLHILFPDPIASFPEPNISSPPLPLNAYTGLYANEYYGDATIFEKEGKLYLAIGPKPEQFLLAPLTRDTFSFETRGENSIGLTQLTFTVDGTGKATKLLIDYLNKNGLGTFPKIK